MQAADAGARPWLTSAFLGLIAAGTSIFFGLSENAILAAFVPVGIFGAVLILSNPLFGAIALILMAYLDGIADMLFSYLPGSPFKAFAALTTISLLLRATEYRDSFRRVFASPIFRSFLAFFCAWVLAIILSENRSVSIEWGGRLSQIFILLPLIAVILVKTNSAMFGVWCLAAASFVSGVILILDTLLNVTLVSTSDAATTARTSEGFDRSSGASQYNPTTAATMLLAGTIAAIVHAIETPRYRKLFLLAATVGSIAVLMSFARSAAIVYAIVALCVAFSYRKHRMFVPYFALACIAGVCMLPIIPASFFERLMSIINSEGDWTLGRRLTYHIIGFDLFFTSPFFGIGPGSFFEFFTDPEFRFLPGRTMSGRQLHNMYLSVLVEYGAIGFMAFVSIIGFSILSCKRIIELQANSYNAVLAKALLWAMVAYFLVSVFVPNEYNKYTWILPALAVAAHSAFDDRK